VAIDRRTEHHIETWLSTFSSTNTRTAYRNDVAVFVAWCGVQGISPLRADAATVEAFRHQLLASGAAPSTASRRTSAVHGFVRSVAEDGDGAPTAAAAGPAPGDGASTTVALSDAERARVLEALPGQVPKAQVLIAMLLLDGLRLDEVLALDTADVTGRPPDLRVRLTRDGTPGELTLHPTTAAVTAVLLANRADAGNDGPLLGGRGEGSPRLTRFGADYLVKRAGREADLDAVLTANVLRRTYVSSAHAAGDALDDIRQRLGHRDARTTRRYLPEPPSRS
jgi:integrase/recombinase XerD